MVSTQPGSIRMPLPARVGPSVSLERASSTAFIRTRTTEVNISSTLRSNSASAGSFLVSVCSRSLCANPPGIQTRHAAEAAARARHSDRERRRVRIMAILLA